MPQQDKRKDLFDFLNKEGYDVGKTYEDFAAKLSDSNKRKEFYEFFNKEGYDLGGDFSSFETKVLTPEVSAEPPKQDLPKSKFPWRAAFDKFLDVAGRPYSALAETVPLPPEVAAKARALDILSHIQQTAVEGGELTREGFGKLQRSGLQPAGRSFVARDADLAVAGMIDLGANVPLHATLGTVMGATPTGLAITAGNELLSAVSPTASEVTNIVLSPVQTKIAIDEKEHEVTGKGRTYSETEKSAGRVLDTLIGLGVFKAAETIPKKFGAMKKAKAEANEKKQKEVALENLKRIFEENLREDLKKAEREKIEAMVRKFEEEVRESEGIPVILTPKEPTPPMTGAQEQAQGILKTRMPKSFEKKQEGIPLSESEASLLQWEGKEPRLVQPSVVGVNVRPKEAPKAPPEVEAKLKPHTKGGLTPLEIEWERRELGPVERGREAYERGLEEQRAKGVEVSAEKVPDWFLERRGTEVTFSPGVEKAIQEAEVQLGIRARVKKAKATAPKEAALTPEQLMEPDVTKPPAETVGGIKARLTGERPYSYKGEEIDATSPSAVAVLEGFGIPKREIEGFQKFYTTNPGGALWNLAWRTYARLRPEAYQRAIAANVIKKGSHAEGSIEAIRMMADQFAAALPKKGVQGQPGLASLGLGAATYGAIEAAPFDDDTKKQLRGLSVMLMVAGIGYGMKGRVADIVKDINASATRKAVIGEVKPQELEKVRVKGMENFLASEDAKLLTAQERTEIRNAFNSAESKGAVAAITPEIERALMTGGTPSEKPIVDPKGSLEDRKVLAAADPAAIFNEPDIMAMAKDLEKNAPSLIADAKSIAAQYARRGAPMPAMVGRNIVRAIALAQLNPKFDKIYQEANKADMRRQTQVSTVEMNIDETMKSVTQPELIRVVEHRFREAWELKKYKDEELTALGYSAPEIAAIKRFRQVQSDVLDIRLETLLTELDGKVEAARASYQAANWQADDLRETPAQTRKIKETKEYLDGLLDERVRLVEHYNELKESGYGTLQRSGKLWMSAEDPTKPIGDPGRTFQRAVKSENTRTKIENDWRRQGLVNIQKYEINNVPYEVLSRLTPYELDMWVESSRADPFSPDIQKLYDEVNSRFKASSYKVRRKYVRGFGTTPTDLVAALLHQTNAYANNGFRRLGKPSVQKAFNESGIHQQKEADLFNFTNNYIEDMFATKPRDLSSKVIHRGMKFTYLMQLGYAMKQWGYNRILQPLMVQSPYFARHEFGLNPAQQVNYFVRSRGLMAEAFKGKANPEYQQYYDRAKLAGQAGGAMSQELSDVMAKEEGAITYGSSWFMREGERGARGHTLAEAYLVGKEKLGYKGEQLFKFMLDSNAMINGRYNVAEVPGIVRRAKGLGDIPRAGYQFQSYSNIVSDNIAVNAIKDWRSGKLKQTALLNMVITWGVLGGLNVYPTSGFFQKLYTRMTGRDGKDDLDDLLGEFFADRVMYGITGNEGVSSAIGVWNRISRDEYGDSIEDEIPAYAQVRQIIRGAEYGIKGELLRSMENLLPAGFRGIPRAIRYYKEGITVTDRGKVKTVKPKSKTGIMDYIGAATDLWKPREVTEYWRKRNLELKPGSGAPLEIQRRLRSPRPTRSRATERP